MFSRVLRQFHDFGTWLLHLVTWGRYIFERLQNVDTCIWNTRAIPLLPKFVQTAILSSCWLSCSYFNIAPCQTNILYCLVVALLLIKTIFRETLPEVTAYSLHCGIFAVSISLLSSIALFFSRFLHVYNFWFEAMWFFFTKSFA